MAYANPSQSPNGSVFLLFGRDNGRDAWYIIRAHKIKEPIVRNFHKTVESYNLNKLGTVLETGWGKEPPEDLKKKYMH